MCTCVDNTKAVRLTHVAIPQLWSVITFISECTRATFIWLLHMSYMAQNRDMNRSLCSIPRVVDNELLSVVVPGGPSCGASWLLRPPPPDTEPVKVYSKIPNSDTSEYDDITNTLGVHAI